MSAMSGSAASTPARIILALLAAGLALGATCDESRERPTGLGTTVPPTTVAVLAPQSNAVLFADSSAVTQVRAEGLLQAVEFIAVSVNPIIDTIAQGRREYDPPIEFVEQEFSFTVPSLISGSSVEIRAIAENLIGQRTSSSSIPVTVVDCDVEPFRCQ